MHYPDLLIRRNQKKLKNRVFKAAMVDCGSWENGKLGANLLKRYEELSKNEVGTIITGTILSYLIQ